MLSSIVYLFLGVSVIAFAGMPAAYFLWAVSDKEKISQIEFWTVTMFAGIGIICTVIKLLFMINIPVAEYGKGLYVLALIFFALFLWGKRKDIIVQRLVKAPLVLLSGMVVYGINGVVYILFGAKYYKAYGFWDLYYYGIQAEAVRSIPFENWSKLADQKIWMIGGTHFTSGVHRISMGALGALVAELGGGDGPSVAGFWIAVTSLLLFATILYATEGMFTSRIKQCVVGLFAVMLPGIVTAQLECFLPVAFFMSFAIFYCRCFYDYYRKSSVRRSVFLALVISAGMTFLLDGTYLLCGLIFVSVLWTLHSACRYKLWENCKKILGIVFSLFLAVVLNVQYLPYILEELQWNMGRESLNGIYYFAYLPSVFNWIFYGMYPNQYADWLPERVMNCFTFVAVLLFLIGICGLVIWTVKCHNGVCLNFLALFCVSLLFYSEPGEHQYAFFKVLHFSFAPIVIGIFLFAKYLRQELKKKQGTLFKVYYHMVTIGVCAVLSLCTVCSLARHLAVFDGLEKCGGRVVGRSVITQSAKVLFQRVEAAKSPMLFVCNDRLNGNDLEMWWASYYGRNKDIYVMAESQLRQFLLAENPDAEYLKVPLDCEIVHIGADKEYIFPEQKKGDYAIYLEQEDSYGYKINAAYESYPEEASNKYSFYIFAREKTKAHLYITIDRDIDITCNKGLVKTENNKGMATFELQEGVNKIPISSSESEFKVTDYQLYILQ